MIEKEEVTLGSLDRGQEAPEVYRSAIHPEIPDWTSKMVEVRIKNPLYDPNA